jgi:NAD+ kinase
LSPFKIWQGYRALNWGASPYFKALKQPKHKQFRNTHKTQHDCFAELSISSIIINQTMHSECTMTQNKYQSIGLTRNIHADVGDVLDTLYQHLLTQGYKVVLGKSCEDWVKGNELAFLPLDEFAEKVDLTIVLGGDGTLLTAARALSDHNVPIIGVNLGRLGFLVDVPKDTMLEEVDKILAGDCTPEERFLLEGRVIRDGEEIVKEYAFNDVILHNRKEIRMVEYSIHIDGLHVNDDRADGLIVCTPTGSTAYSLSSGGPILYPTLEAIALVPVCPHTLSHRPLVVNSKSHITITIDEKNVTAAQVTFDGQANQHLQAGDRIEIRTKSRTVTLLHPADYNYYDILREKLHWGNNLTR